MVAGWSSDRAVAHLHAQPHARALDGQDGAQLRQRLQRLHLGRLGGVHGKVQVSQAALDDARRVRSLGVSVDALLHQHVDHVPKQRVQLLRALLVRHLQGALVQDLAEESPPATPERGWIKATKGGVVDATLRMQRADRQQEIVLCEEGLVRVSIIRVGTNWNQIGNMHTRVDRQSGHRTAGAGDAEKAISFRCASKEKMGIARG